MDHEPFDAPHTSAARKRRRDRRRRLNERSMDIERAYSRYCLKAIIIEDALTATAKLVEEEMLRLLEFRRRQEEQARMDPDPTRLQEWLQRVGEALKEQEHLVSFREEFSRRIKVDMLRLLEEESAKLLEFPEVRSCIPRSN